MQVDRYRPTTVLQGKREGAIMAGQDGAGSGTGKSNKSTDAKLRGEEVIPLIERGVGRVECREGQVI